MVGVNHSGARWAGALVCVVLGAALQVQQSTVWPVATYAGGVGAALCLWVALSHRPAGRVPQWLGGLLAGLLLGGGVAGLQAHQRLGERLDPALEGRDLVVSGTIAGLPRHDVGVSRFVFEPQEAWLDDKAVMLPRRILLSWHAGFDGRELNAGPGPELKAAQRWRLHVRLRRPHGALNPHGFDFELWMFEQGLGATGYVRSGHTAQAQLLAAPGGHWVQRARQWVRDRIEAAVPDARSAGVLSALVVGDQAAIDRDDWDIFRITGVAHLMSISGLHVTMFAWIVGLLLRRLWAWQPRWGLRVAAPVAARWGGLIAALAYAVFSGWGVPAQRTVWMLAVVVLVAQSGRRWPWPMVLAAAAALVCLLDPWAVLQPGFWLSFVAVAVLMAADAGPWAAASLEPSMAGSRLAGWLRRWRGTAMAGLRTQWVATLGLAPLSLVFFQQVSLVGLLANLVAIPLVTLVVTPAGILGVMVPGAWPLAAWLVEQLSALLAMLARWPWAQWTTAAAAPWAMACGLVGGALLTLPLPWRVRVLALPLVWPLLWPLVDRPSPGTYELLALDVGQGTAVLVRTARHTLLYDAGPQYSRDSDAGRRVVVPALQALGEQRLDLLMLSHRDADHVGGVRAVLQRYPDTPVSSSLEPGHPLRAGMALHRRCEAGQSWVWDGVRFSVLHPGPHDAAPPLKPNQVSCVLRIEAAGQVALLAGDIERGEEARLVAAQGQALASQLLLVPHHGSRTSSTAPFLAAVRPQVAVFQAGYRNRFGHPAADVLSRYERHGIAVVTTAQCGAYRWQGGQGRCERDLRRRYWHHGAVEPQGAP